MTATWKERLGLVTRVTPGAVLIIAGFTKAVGPPTEFAAAIDAYQLVPWAWTKSLALILPWLEMYTGLFLVTGFGTRFAASVGAGLYALFIGALSAALMRGLDLVSCGCFGSWIHLPPPVTLVIDAVLLVCCILNIKRPCRWASLDAWVEQSSDPRFSKRIG